jgi:signal transduction histidine kinase
MTGRIGLRPRLLVALLAVSLVTLGAAALTLLPPLREKLRTESIRSTLSATDAQIEGFEHALRHDPKCLQAATRDQVGTLVGNLTDQINAQVYVVDIVPRALCGLTDPRAASDTLVQQSLTSGSVDLPVHQLRGEDLEIVVPLGTGEHPAQALIVNKPLNDVSGAVHQVQTSFETAALIGLGAALILGLGLATTLVRRVERLRRAAQRVTREGAGAPRPRDDGRDEIGDLARSFAAMQDALLRQEEARRAFVATASHELRTPLTSLSGMLELLDEDLIEGRLDLTDAHQQVASARRELRRLGNLAAELLDLSRLDAGVPLRSEPVELGELARAVAFEFEQRATERGVTVDVVPPIGPCWARGDPSAIARVLRILLDNAMRFSPARESVRVAAHYSGDQALFEVADSGPGVPDAERELIFERFKRGTRTGGEGGFGLGLAIGRELAERLSGTLRLAPADVSHPGARFICALPIEMPAGGGDRPEPASQPSRPAVP